ncbi:MAG: hemerythrin family protein [Chloroflexi bacterium]|nr:hemerythrin family protein [Chloroflexota bacterium]
MEAFSWDEGWATGHAEVDRQHQALFQLVNHLEQAIAEGRGKDVLEATLDGLSEYVIVHFQTEEKLMRETGYPHLAEHQAIHAGLTKRAQELISGYKSGKITMTLRVTRFLSDWIQTHIVKEDMHMIRYVRCHGRQ